MKRITSLLVILSVLVILIGLVGCSDTSVDSSSEDSQISKDVAVKFEGVSSLEDIVALSQANNIPFQEIVCNYDNITFGYSVNNVVLSNNDILSFKNKHKEFLKNSLEIIQDNIDSPTSSRNFSKYQALKNKFHTMLNTRSDYGMIVARAVVDNVSNLKPLEESGVLKIKCMECDEGITENGQKIASRSESWAPNYGKSRVTSGFTMQFFEFDDVSDFMGNVTYEHETQIYNNDFANYDNYWSTTMPNGYKDTQFLDDIDNFTIGCDDATDLAVDELYYTYMALTGGSASTATVRIKGQKGHRTPSFCYWTWCIFADATTSSLTTYTAPINYYKTWSY